MNLDISENRRVSDTQHIQNYFEKTAFDFKLSAIESTLLKCSDHNLLVLWRSSEVSCQ